MNTMVGLQASLHTSVEDEISDLMKNGDDFLASGTEGEVVFDDDFDPEELLKSPLFNDSREKLDCGGEDETFTRNFGGESASNARMPKRGSPISPENSDYASSSYETPRTSPKLQYPYRRTEQSVPLKISGSSSSPSYVNSNEVFRSQHMPQVGHDSLFESSYLEGSTFTDMQPRAQRISSMDDSVNSHFSHASLSDNSMRMQHSYAESATNMCSDQTPMQPIRRIPDRSRTYNPDIQSPLDPYKRCGTERSQSYNVRNQLNTMNPLQQMQHMQQLESVRRVNENMALSQSMHNMQSGSMNHGSSLYGDRMPYSMGNGRDPLSTGSYHGTPYQSNVSIASGGQFGKGHSGGQNPPQLTDAMEKLCETMKRSAMSRTLIKQYSGRGGMKQGSSHQILRQNSGRDLMMDNSGREHAVRRMTNTKHRIQPHPTLGVYRQNSHQSLGNHSNHGGISLQLDGHSMGNF